MFLRRLTMITAVIVLGAAAYCLNSIQADEWLPISQEELKMTGVPEAPGAPAIILYRQVDRDDSSPRTPNEYNYVREKIFTEEGRKYANAEIRYVKDEYNIVNLRARTVHPDGTAVDFDGKIYDKEIVKGNDLKVLAKTFSFSDVQPGSIIEYHYMIDFAENYVFDSNWILSGELFTKSAKFSLKPYPEWVLSWAWPNGLPKDTRPPEETKGVGHIIRMEANNIPAFLAEDDMPPEDAMKLRVDFTYHEGGVETDPTKFWKKEDKKHNDYVEGFVNKKKAMEEAVASIASPSDTPEAKLRKIYARVQQLKNTSYELEKTDQEKKRAQEKASGNAEDVWKRGYGTGDQLTLLFLGLARAAGFDASAVYASTRDDHFFTPSVMKATDLHTYIARVKLNGKDVDFDPGSKFTPFGLLPWAEAGTQGLKLDKDGGTWVATADPASDASQIDRKADLKVTQDGNLEGKLTVTYTGLEAQRWRVGELHEDDASRKKDLEDSVRSMVPAAVEVELTNKPDWSSSETNLVTEYSLKVPGWVSGAGRRALLPVGIFSAPEKHRFEHTTRVQPMYFHYQSQKVDDITIELPLGWQVSSLPKEQSNDAKALVYSMKVDNNNGTLHLERQLTSKLILLDSKFYPTVRKFYEIVRTGDEEQIVLQPLATAASN